MFLDKFVVHSLPVLAGKGKHTSFNSIMDKDVTKMQTSSVIIATFNINGVLNPVKRGKILSKLKKDKTQVAFLQETHLNDSEHAKLNRSGFKHVFFSSYASGRRRGVGTLISGAVNFKYISEH